MREANHTLLFHLDLAKAQCIDLQEENLLHIRRKASTIEASSPYPLLYRNINLRRNDRHRRVLLHVDMKLATSERKLWALRGIPRLCSTNLNIDLRFPRLIVNIDRII